MFSIYIKQHKRNSVCNRSSGAFPDIRTAWIERLCKLKHIVPVVFIHNAVRHMAYSICKVMAVFCVSVLLLMINFIITFHIWPSVKKLDHVYFVHPSTDVLVDISTDSRPTYRLTYRPSIGRYVDWHSTDTSVDMSTKSGCPIVDRHVSR